MKSYIAYGTNGKNLVFDKQKENAELKKDVEYWKLVYVHNVISFL